MAKNNFKIDFSDIRRIEKNLREATKESKSGSSKVVLKATLAVRNKAIDNTKAGTLYGDGIYETGNLRRSITFDLLNPYTGVAGTSRIDYGKFVEYGTRRMRAKPFMRPAYDSEKPKIQKMFSDYLRGISKIITK